MAFLRGPPYPRRQQPIARDASINVDDPDNTNGRDVVIRVMRWLAVVPAAVLGSWLGYGLGGVFQLLRQPYYPDFVFPLLQLVPSGVLFSVCGGMTAPGRRVTVAGLLAVLCSVVALQRHILGQSAPGLTNYMHWTAETLGAAIGVVVVYRVVRRDRE